MAVYWAPSVQPISGEDKVVCCRCLQDGTADNKGEYLLIKARRWYDKEDVPEGAEKITNQCVLRCRYKEAGASTYTDWITLLEADAESDSFAGAVEGVTMGKGAYSVQLQVEDGYGYSKSVISQVGAMMATLHLGKGGKNVAIGQYCDYTHEDALDIGLMAFFNGGVGKRAIFEGIEWVPPEELTLDNMFGTPLTDATQDADTAGIEKYTLFFVLFENLHAEVCVYWEGGILGPSVQMVTSDGNLSLMKAADTITHMYAIL